MGLVNPFQTNNIDSGARWIVNDVARKPLYMWDSRSHKTKQTYDVLQRPLEVILAKNSTDYVVEKYMYGTDAAKKKHRSNVRSVRPKWKTNHRRV